MRATSPLVLFLLMVLASTAASATRVLVAPVSGDNDATTRETVGHAIEASVAHALPDSEIVSTTTIENASELAALRDCVGDEVAAACLSEVAGAANADVVVRSHLGRLGEELVLSISVLDATSSKVLGQGQRRVDRARAAALLDRVPELVDEVLRDSGHFEAPTASVVPAVVTGVGAATLVGAAVVWGVFGVQAAAYANAQLDADEARSFEQNRLLLALGASALTVAGGAALAAGVWMLGNPE